MLGGLLLRADETVLVDTLLWLGRSGNKYPLSRS